MDLLRTISEMAEKKRVRYEEVEQAGTSITSLVRDCQKYFQASDGSESWRKYLSFVDEVVVDGLLKQCASSLGYLIDETDPTITEGVLVEVKLELSEPDVIFQPSLDTHIVGNFFDRMSGYIDDILHVCRLVPRVAHYHCSPAEDDGKAVEISHKKNDETSKVNYYKVISRHREFKRMTEQVMDRVRSVMNLSNKHKGMYTEYSYLWMESRVEFMHYFLAYGRQLTQEELEQLEEDDKAVKRQYPTLAQFREQIDYYEGLHEQLKSIEVTKIFHSWFRVDIRAVTDSFRKSQCTALHFLS